MSHAARHSFHTASDRAGVEQQADAGAGSAHAAPILIARADANRAFDLFQPEQSEADAIDREHDATPVVPIGDGQFARQVARALDAPRPSATGLNLPLGGIAPTDREIASARALMIGWLAACAIAAFAFLSQGPTITGRAGDPDPDPAPAPLLEEARASSPGDIRLAGPAAAKPTVRPRKNPGGSAPAAPPAKP